MRPLQAHCHHGLGTLYATVDQREQARTALTTNSNGVFTLAFTASGAQNSSELNIVRSTERMSPSVSVKVFAILSTSEAGGSSLRDHRQADGSLGYFQHRFMVYDCEGQGCLRPRCRGVIARAIQAGRSTFHCPVCQK